MFRDLLTRLSDRRDATTTSRGTPREPENNDILLQAFEWYSLSDGQHWLRIKDALPLLQSIGVTALWLPPGCKAGSDNSNGYDLYDLWDLGEFNQKDHIATKWGSKDDLVSLCHEAHSKGIGVLWDAVLNHKAGGDYTQLLRAAAVSAEDRRHQTGPEHEIESWVGFDFAGRNGKYSDFKWNGAHFNGTDWDQRTQTNAIYKILGAGEKDWAHDVDREKGNFDYLLCHNVDLARSDVRDDYSKWIAWLGHELGITGVRFDAAKHMSRAFMKDHINRIDSLPDGRNWWLIGEYCTGNVQVLKRYIDDTDGRMCLFDFPLHQNMVNMARPDADLRNIFSRSLVEVRSANTVTFVTNHDSQARDGSQELTEVAPFFIPMAYALILLLAHVGRPCVFWGDIYGVRGPEQSGRPATCEGKLPKLLLTRKLYAYGPEKRYFDERRCIGFTRAGHHMRSGGAGLAVVVNVGHLQARKRMHVGVEHAGERWVDLYGMSGGEIDIDSKGWGAFTAEGRSLSVWVNGAAEGLQQINQVAL